ncbi:MAG: hypothetical protein JSW00_03995 [Thermoplasmata archaeon]|nr:MAG: hypothetical protein JSW00_03995 [Thermoplasmata archaeon]
MTDKLLLTEKEASDRYSLSRTWFQRRRLEEDSGPPWITMGAKILYPTKETDEWFMSHYIKTGEEGND